MIEGGTTHFRLAQVGEHATEGGDVRNVTEEIENNFGTGQLVTRVEVLYDGDRFEEFAIFYASWIVENGNPVLDARSTEGLTSFSGYLPPGNDTYGVTRSGTPRWYRACGAGCRDGRRRRPAAGEPPPGAKRDPGGRFVRAKRGGHH